MKRAFTLIELIVVLGIIAILAGTVGAGVNGARKRALITRAQAEAQEMTNAILAYANYTEDGTLRNLAGKLSNTEANESSLDFLLGKGPQQRNATVPVLYNASVAKGSGRFLDPWGHPYRVTVKKGENLAPPGIPALQMKLFYPNWHRVGR